MIGKGIIERFYEAASIKGGMRVVGGIYRWNSPQDDHRFSCLPSMRLMNERRIN